MIGVPLRSDPDAEGRKPEDLPFPTKDMHDQPCPNCSHLMGEHVSSWGCSAGWSWYGPESHLSGLSKSEGCECPLALANDYGPPNEGDI